MLIWGFFFYIVTTISYLCNAQLCCSVLCVCRPRNPRTNSSGLVAHMLLHTGRTAAGLQVHVVPLACPLRFGFLFLGTSVLLKMEISLGGWVVINQPTLLGWCLQLFYGPSPGSFLTNVDPDARRDCDAKFASTSDRSPIDWGTLPGRVMRHELTFVKNEPHSLTH